VRGFVLTILATSSLAIFLFLLGDRSTTAAPSLQLPWPAGHQHRINGGYTYGCGTHTTSVATSSTAYNADYYAIDFQFGSIDGSPLDIGAVATGLVVFRGNANDLYGNKIVLDHGGGYTSIYAHMSSFSVVLGAKVLQGQLVGYAGNTGHPAYPVHLHMHVMSGLNAYKPEPMSGVPGPVSANSFGHYGYSAFNSGNCGSGPNDPSPYWASRPPYVGIEGSLLKGTASADIFVLDQGSKRKIASSGLFTSCGYQWADVAVVPQTVADSIPPGTAVSVKPCPYTLVKTTSSNDVFVIEQGKRRKIAGSSVLTWCGYGAITIVTSSDLTGNTTPGPDLTRPPCPYTRTPWFDQSILNGALVKRASSPDVFVIDIGGRRYLSASMFATCGYSGLTVLTISDQAFNAMPQGSTVTSPPCPHTLHLISGPIYVIENGMKRQIMSTDAMDWCGYFWKNVVTPTPTSIPTAPGVYNPPCPYARR
jgi:hypothetical protein